MVQDECHLKLRPGSEFGPFAEADARMRLLRLGIRDQTVDITLNVFGDKRVDVLDR